MYVKGSGVEEKFVVLADDEYNEMEIPLSRFVGYTTVEEGATVVLYKDDEEIVKIVVQKWWRLTANRRDCGEVIYFDPIKIQKGQVSGIQVFQNPNRIIPSPQGGFCTEFRSLRFSSRIPPGSRWASDQKKLKETLLVWTQKRVGCRHWKKRSYILGNFGVA